MKDLLFGAMRAGIKFQLDGEDLRICAPPGAMTADLRRMISDNKAVLIGLLRDGDAGSRPVELPQIEHDRANRHEPFPLTDVQHAYWVGRQSSHELGNVSTHFYFELDCLELDIGRLNMALNRLIERHEMLRAIMTDDGRQRILDSVPSFDIALHDAADLDQDRAEACIRQVRNKMSHEVRPADCWPLFDFQATQLPNWRVRLHVSLDMLILDGWSIFTMFDELFRLYGNPDAILPPLHLSYRDYVIAERNALEGEAHRRARAYWTRRIDTLPAAPELPMADGSAAAVTRFRRRRAGLEWARWVRLREKAQRHGLTPSALLLAVYAEVLARWSRSRHFTLNLTLFNRQPVHPDVMRVLGDFTSLVMVEVDHRSGGTSFLQRAQSLQRQFMEDLDHHQFSGVEVLREWSYRRRGGTTAAMPVVFTSALVRAGDTKVDAGIVEQLGPMVYGVSQTPQVWLDNQVMELDGELVFNWDAVEGIFAPGVLDAMFEAHCHLMRTLADDEAAWQQPLVIPLPEAMAARRAVANATASLLAGGLLHADFLDWAHRTPDAVAVIAEERRLTYRQLLGESAALAQRLRAEGVAKGDLVAVLMHKGWEQVVAVFGVLMAGATYLPVDAGLPVAGGAIVIPARRPLPDASQWRAEIAQHGVTVWNSAPQLMRLVMDDFGAGEAGPSSLRWVLLSGDWVPLPLPGKIGRHYPNARVTAALGGATEASIWSNYFHVQDIDPDWASIPYGVPLPNQTMRVLDPEMRPCPDQVTGRIFIGGQGLARGYWRDEERTAARFVLHPETGERLYDTGDLGRYAPDGTIIFLGRDDRQVKIRGHRVELGEVAAVLRRHSEIAEAEVVTFGDRVDRRELVAYVALKLGEPGNLAAIPPAAPFAGQALQQVLASLPVGPAARTPTSSFLATWSMLDQLYFNAMIRTLRQFGVVGQTGERITLERVLAQGVAGRYWRWLLRALDALVEDGYARRLGSGSVEIVRPLPSLDELGTERLGQRLQSDLGFDAIEVEWLFDSARRIPEILTETLHSAELYASEHMVALYEKMFPDCHAELARVVEHLLRTRIGESAEGLAVIEVGGGLASAARHVAPVLARHGCRYSFTDISEFFLRRAAEYFATSGLADRLDIGYGLLDLDVRPEFQACGLHGYDMALALSMLHDVPDVRVALGHLRLLLKPGGYLVMLEQTRFFRSFDLQSGLQQGFDSFVDENLRQAHSLLSREQWEAVLADQGFAQVATVAMPGSVAEQLGFHIIVAKAPDQAVQLRSDAVIAYLSDHLPDHAVPHRIVQLDRMPLSANGKIDHQALPPVPDWVVFANAQRVTPRTDSERALLDIWLRLMPGQEIGVTDNFFEIGGDSLVATQVIREINETLSFNLQMADFFEHTNIEALAKLYDCRKVEVELL